MEEEIEAVCPCCGTRLSISLGIEADINRGAIQAVLVKVEEVRSQGGRDELPSHVGPSRP